MNDAAIESIPDGPAAGAAGDSSTVTRPAVSFGLAARAVTPLAVLVIVQSIVNIWPRIIAARPFGPWFDWVPPMNLALGMLLGAWMSLGPLRWRRQLPLALVGLTVLVGTHWFGTPSQFTANTIQNFGLLILFPFGMISSVVGVGWYLRRVRAWRLVPRDWPYSIPPGRPVRFSLRQMLVATAVVGLILTLRADQTLLPVVISGMIGGLVGAVVLVPTLVLLVGAPRTMLTMLDTGALLLVAGGWAWAFPHVGSRTEAWALLVWYGVLVISLLWLRFWGLRLVRGEPSESRIASQSPVEQ